MAEFDPDAYLGAAPAFDPDAYLKAGEPAAEVPAFKPGAIQQRQHTYRGAIRAGAPELPAGAGADVEPQPELRHDDLGQKWGQFGKGLPKGAAAGLSGGIAGDIEQMGRHTINKLAQSDVVDPKTAIPTTTEGGYLGPKGADILAPAANEDEALGMNLGAAATGAGAGKLLKTGAAAFQRAFPPLSPETPPVVPPRAAPAGFETVDPMTGKTPVVPGSDLPRTPEGSIAPVVREGSGARLLPADVPHVETPGTLDDALAGRRSAGAAGVSPLDEFSPETIAHMRKTLQEENVTPWTLDQRLEEMSPHQSLAEFSPNTEAHAGAVAAPPGAAKNEVINFFKQRAVETKDRMRSIFDQAFGRAEDLAERRRVSDIDQNNAAGPLYQRFRSMAVPPSPELDALMPRLQAADVFGVARHKAALEGRPFAADWFTPEQRTSPTAQSWDYVKRSIDELIGNSYNAATHRATDYTRIYRNLKSDLMRAFDEHPNAEIADVWRQARAAWAEPEAIKNAEQLGHDLLSKKINKDEFRFDTSGFSDAERQGVIRGLRADLENSLGEPGKTELPTMKKVLGENNQAKMRWVIGDDQTDALVKSIEHEFNMHGAPTRIHGNSPTALRLEAQKAWTPQAGAVGAGDLLALTHGVGHAVAKTAAKVGLGHLSARELAKFARLRDEAARIFTMQGPERDAVLRHLLSEEPPKRKKGGRVIKRAEGGEVATDDIAPPADQTMRELAAKARGIAVRSMQSPPEEVAGVAPGGYLLDDPAQAQLARETAARGVARGAEHYGPLSKMEPEGYTGVSPSWMMEPDLMGVQSGNVDLPPGVKLDDAGRPFYPDTGKYLDVVKRPGLLPIAQTPDGPQFVMPKLLDLASNVMSPLAAGKVPVKAGEMVLGSGAVRRGVEQPWQVKGFEDADWFHGTTHDFDKFSKAKGNPENYLGKHPHFTSDPEDAAANYAGHGPDLTGRIERRAEELTNDMTYGYGTPEYKAAMEKARGRATRELAGPHSGAIIPAKMKLNNPASLVDSKPTWLDFNPVWDKAGEEVVKEAPALDKLHRFMLSQGEKYGFDGQKVFGDVAEKAQLYDGDVRASALHKAIKDNEELLDVHDAKGNTLGSHLAAEAFKALGFDGIVMDAKAAFPNMKNIREGTLHAVPLKRNTVKGKFNDQVLYSDTRNQVVGQVGHQIEKAQQPFYSSLERAVEGAKLTKGTPEQWAGYLRNQPGVKSDEMDPLLGDWLKEQKGPVTKQQIADHIRDNKVEVKEVQKGGGDVMDQLSERERQKFDEAVQERVSHLEDEWAMEQAHQAADKEVMAISTDVEQNPETGRWRYVLSNGQKSGWIYGHPDSARGAGGRDAAKAHGDAYDERKWHHFERFSENAWMNGEHGGAGVDVPQIEREVRDEMGLSGDGTKWADYQLPGGENYREKLLTLPLRAGRTGDAWSNYIAEMKAKYGDDFYASNKMTAAERSRLEDLHRKAGYGAGDPQNNFKSGHWDEPNVLAHVRMNDRAVAAPGESAPKKSLHLEEIQSDWHQKGRAQGYAKDTKGWTAQLLSEPDAGFTRWQVDDASGNRVTTIVGGDAGSAIRKAAEGIPDAPFKKTWHELALKHALEDAVKGGYDRLSWTPGEAQADRYDLSRHLTDLRAVRSIGDGGNHYTLDAIRKGYTDRTRVAENVAEKDLAEHVGKDMAEKIIKDIDAAQNNRWGVKNRKSGFWSQRFSSKAEAEAYQKNLPDSIRSDTDVHEMTPKYATEYSGLDLKVGGEGMKGFYDQIVPKALERLTKKYGVKVKGGIVDGDKYTMTGNGPWTIRDSKGAYVDDFNNKSKAEVQLDRFNRGHDVHYIDIPQALKDDITKHGQPLFARGGAVRKAKKMVVDTAAQLAMRAAVRRAIHAD